MTEPTGTGHDGPPRGAGRGEALPPQAPAYDLRTGQPLAAPDESDELGIWAPDGGSDQPAPQWGPATPGGYEAAAPTWSPEHPPQGYPPQGYSPQDYPRAGYYPGPPPYGGDSRQPLPHTFPGQPGPPSPGSSTGLRWALAVAGVLIVAAVAVLGVVLLRGSSSPPRQSAASASAPGAAPGSSSAGGGTSAPNSDAARTAFLNQVDGILNQSSSGRSQVQAVVSGVQNGCTVPPESASSTIRQVIANRQSVLAQANALSAPDAATQAVKAELVSALTASIEANRSYEQWFDYLYTSYYNAEPVGCPNGQAPTDQHYDAATAASGRATAAKQTFVADYNPLAARAGLRSWTESEF